MTVTTYTLEFRGGREAARRRVRTRHQNVAVAMAVALVAASGFGVGRLALSPAGRTTAEPVAPAAVVLLLGDSLLREAAPGIRAALPGTTVVDGTAAGSGLLDGPVDWSARAASLLARWHPTIVVVSFIGNYDQSAGPLVADTDAYYAAWAGAEQRLTDVLRASGARVDWVEQPPLSSPNFYGVAPTRTARLFAQYRHLATEPGVGLVGATDAVAAADGSFTMTHDVCGRPETVRIADGVHFTAVGADWWGAQLGRAVAQLEGLATRDACSVVRGLDPGLP